MQRIGKLFASEKGLSEPRKQGNRRNEAPVRREVAR
jgi:hypothetical protein